MEPHSRADGKQLWEEETDGFAESRPRSRFRWARLRRKFAGILLIITIFFVFLAPYVFVNVPVGSAGVLWRRFGGTERDFVIPTGMTAKWPWDIIYIYNLRLQAEHVDIVALTSDALNISVSITFRWFANPEALPKLHDIIGPNYTESLLLPEINSSTRRSFSLYSANDFYGLAREDVMRSVFDSIVEPDSDNFTCRAIFDADKRPSENNPSCLLYLADVLIRDVSLPPRIVAAIQSKIEQKQLVQEMGYRVERERIEAERKLVEAEGIRMFQETVQTGISETYLKWRGIEATVLLATSPNAKTVVIGGAGSLPLILNTGDSATPSTVASPATVSETTPGTEGTESSTQLAGLMDVSRPGNQLQSSSFSSSAILPNGAWSSDVLNGNLARSSYALTPDNASRATHGALDPIRPMAALGAQSIQPTVPAGISSMQENQSTETIANPHLSRLINNQLSIGGAADLFSSLPSIYGTWLSSQSSAARNAP